MTKSWLKIFQSGMTIFLRCWFSAIFRASVYRVKKIPHLISGYPYVNVAWLGRYGYVLVNCLPVSFSHWKNSQKNQIIFLHSSVKNQVVEGASENLLVEICFSFEIFDVFGIFVSPHLHFVAYRTNKKNMAKGLSHKMEPNSN